MKNAFCLYKYFLSKNTCIGGAADAKTSYLRTELTRALEGGLRITPSGGGGAYNAPPSISAPMRASATNFGGYLGPYYNFFWTKFWDRGSTPSRSKRVEFQKCLSFWQKRTVFRFFRASSVTIIAMKNLKKAFIRKLLKRSFAKVPSDFG